MQQSNFEVVVGLSAASLVPKHFLKPILSSYIVLQKKCDTSDAQSTFP